MRKIRYAMQTARSCFRTWRNAPRIYCRGLLAVGRLCAQFFPVFSDELLLRISFIGSQDALQVSKLCPADTGQHTFLGYRNVSDDDEG